MPQSRFPHPLTLLTGCVLLVAALSYVLPAGEYDRTDDPVTGRTVVVAGTFHEVEPNPVNLFQAMADIPKGMFDSGDIIFLVFLTGGAFTVVDETGTLLRSVSWLVHRLHDRGVLVIPIGAVPFATAGALENMKEEIIRWCGELARPPPPRPRPGPLLPLGLRRPSTHPLPCSCMGQPRAGTLARERP